MAKRSRGKSSDEDPGVAGKDETKSQAGATAGAPAAGGGASRPQWPLFYRKPVPLSVERHGSKSITLERRFSFASGTNMVPLNAPEFPRAATAYPIVFTESPPASAIAILGLRQGQNLFVDEAGAWAGGVYVPAYVRRYPFIFSTGPGADQLVLCIDESDETLVDSSGADGTQPVYDGQEATEVIKRMLDFCAAFHRQSLGTREFIDAMEERELFRPGTVTITADSGEQFNLRGFRVIDEAKFGALPDDVYLEFRRKGWLVAIISHLISIQNLASLGYRSRSGA